MGISDTYNGSANRFAPSRRGLITGLAALIAAPALVRASSIMPVKAWVDGVPASWRGREGLFWFCKVADGVHFGRPQEEIDIYTGHMWAAIQRNPRSLSFDPAPPQKNLGTLLSEGRLPEVSRWKDTAGPGGECAPERASFPSRSPAVVQSHQRALPMLGGRRHG